MHFIKASFNAEEADKEGAVLDASKAQRIQQLETLLQEFKDTNAQLTKKVDALGGGSASLKQGQGQNEKALSIEIEQAQRTKIELQKCMVFIVTDMYPIFALIMNLQPWMQQKPRPSNILTRLNDLNNLFLSSVGKSVRGDTSPQACVYCL